jgi:hypothetical protein
MPNSINVHDNFREIGTKTIDERNRLTLGAVDQQLELLLANPQHPSLNLKKMQEPRNIWEGRVSVPYRFTLQIKNDVYLLRKVGTHDILNNP